MARSTFSGPVASDNGFIGNTSSPAIAAIPVLTGAFGSTGNAIADVTGAFSQTILNNNFRALEDKINAILAALD